MKFQQSVEKSAEVGESINYDKILDLVISISTNLLMAFAILVIGFWVVKKAMKVLEFSLEKANLSPEITSFLSSLLSAVMKVFILLAAIGQVGVDTAYCIVSRFDCGGRVRCWDGFARKFSKFCGWNYDHGL